MKIFKISCVLISLILSACTYAAPSPPTATLGASLSVLPSEQVSPTEALLPLPTKTPTQEPLPTDTIQPTEPPLPTATPTSGLIMEIITAAPRPTVQAQACGRPANWAAYTVQRGDTLSSLAQRTNTSTQQIQTANCLAGTLILAGQVLYLPFVPAPLGSGGTGSTGGNNPPTESSSAPAIRTPVVGLPGDHPVNISPASGPPGTVFMLSVDHYSANEQVIITIVSVETGQMLPVQTRYTAEDGTLIWYFSSPGNMAEGDYNVFEDGMQSGATGKGHFSIVPPTP